METTYASAGITRFAAWAHESDVPMRHHLEVRGYTLDVSTRAMGAWRSTTSASPRPGSSPASTRTPSTS